MITKYGNRAKFRNPTNDDRKEYDVICRAKLINFRAAAYVLRQKIEYLCSNSNGSVDKLIECWQELGEVSDKIEFYEQLNEGKWKDHYYVNEIRILNHYQFD